MPYAGSHLPTNPQFFNLKELTLHQSFCCHIPRHNGDALGLAIAVAQPRDYCRSIDFFACLVRYYVSTVCGDVPS